MSPVRTAKLASGLATNVVGFTIFSVPSTNTWLVKGITATNDANAGSITVEIYLVDTFGERGALVHGAIAAGASLQFNGFAVAGPGDSMALSVSGGTVSWWISGAKLAGVAP